MNKGLLIKTSIKISVSISVAQSRDLQEISVDFSLPATRNASAERKWNHRAVVQGDVVWGLPVSCLPLALKECSGRGHAATPGRENQLGASKRMSWTGEARWRLSCRACRRFVTVHTPRGTLFTHSSPLGDADPGSSGSDRSWPPSETQTWPSVNVYTRCFLYQINMWQNSVGLL